MHHLGFRCANNRAVGVMAIYLFCISIYLFDLDMIFLVVVDTFIVNIHAFLQFLKYLKLILFEMEHLSM